MKFFQVLFISLLLLSCTDDEESNNIINNETMPQLIEIFPTASDNGDDIILHGKNFGGERGSSLVYFNDIPAESYRIWADTVIHLTIPTGAVSGKVRIVKKAEEESNELYFTVKSFGGFPSVAIGRQVWMKRNLNIIEYPNGDRLVRALSDEDWEKYCYHAWCYPNNGKKNDTVGKLYGYYALVEHKGMYLAPEGWHVALKKDWDKLFIHLGMTQEEIDSNYSISAEKGIGDMLKSNDSTFWDNYSPTINNITGFGALPGGIRWEEKGKYYGKRSFAAFWYKIDNTVRYLILDGDNSGWSLGMCIFAEIGASIRCVRDE